MPDYARLGSLADCLRLTAPGVRVTRGLGRPVIVGARAGPVAWAGGVLVTSTAQMLVPGSGIGFARRGLSISDALDRWQLSAVEQA